MSLLHVHCSIWYAKYDMFLTQYILPEPKKAPIRIKLVTSNTEIPAIHDAGDVTDCLVVSLWSISVAITKLLLSQYQQ